jgi:3-methyladenine DNA glycosylase AlkD
MVKQNRTDEIVRQLKLLADEEKKNFLPRFFKTGKGEYGEGERFLGVVVPRVRSVVKEYRATDFETITELLTSPWHEVRLCGLLLLVDNFKRGDDTCRREVFEYYLSHTKSINNWDLVDLSAPYIVGSYLVDRPVEDRQILYRLANSYNLWEKRIAVVSTIAFIRNNNYEDILHLAELLMQHPHDLMHKAIGWMLREVGKRNETVLRSFLDNHVLQMPRTMLRYAIEKFDEKERQYYLKRR